MAEVSALVHHPLLIVLVNIVMTAHFPLAPKVSYRLVNLHMQKMILIAILMTCCASATAHARCGYYVGYGYRCFGDKGGTGGKAFKKMDENTKKCGYWDPGCQRDNQNKVQKRPKSSQKN
jgi:hypothetical protein